MLFQNCYTSKSNHFMLINVYTWVWVLNNFGYQHHHQYTELNRPLFSIYNLKSLINNVGRCSDWVIASWLCRCGPAGTKIMTYHPIFCNFDTVFQLWTHSLKSDEALSQTNSSFSSCYQVLLFPSCSLTFSSKPRRWTTDWCFSANEPPTVSASVRTVS